MGALILSADLIELAALLGIVLYLFNHADDSERRSPIMLLAFSYAVLFVSNLYWVAHELMTREAIYEFSAIDIASAGLYLLAGASLGMMLRREEGLDVPVCVGSGAFALGQGVLWLIWTGAWFKDLVGCLPTWYLTYYVVCALKVTRAFSKGERIALVAFSLSVFALQAWGFVARDTYGSLLDAGSGIVCLAVTAYLAVRLWRSWQGPKALGQTVALAFAVVDWTFSSMYLMYDPLYSVFLLLSSVALVIVGIAVVRKVEAA